MANSTWQEWLLHCFHQTLEVVFYIVHYNIDFIHITTYDDFLQHRNK